MWFRVKKQQKQKSFAKDLFAFPPRSYPYCQCGTVSCVSDLFICLLMGCAWRVFIFYFKLETRDAYAIPTPQIRLWNLYVGNENYASQSDTPGGQKNQCSTFVKSSKDLGWMGGCLAGWPEGNKVKIETKIYTVAEKQTKNQTQLGMDTPSTRALTNFLVLFSFSFAKRGHLNAKWGWLDGWLPRPPCRSPCNKKITDSTGQRGVWPLDNFLLFISLLHKFNGAIRLFLFRNLSDFRDYRRRFVATEPNLQPKAAQNS